MGCPDSCAGCEAWDEEDSGSSEESGCDGFDTPLCSLPTYSEIGELEEDRAEEIEERLLR